MKAILPPLAAVCLAAGAAAQQTTPPAPQPDSLARVLSESAPPPASLANVSVDGVSLSGPLSVEDGRAFIGNNGAITAGDQSVMVSLTRGGNLNVCASTQIHLSSDTAISGGGLMIALNRGALEGHYIPGQYSDVVLTPDLRILISGPGLADFSLRVNNQGDTCIDNRGDHAPYIVAANLFEGGAYRIQPNQRVLFEHGSLQQVVDMEKESCGCPPPEPTPPPASVASTAGRNPFPLAESEGLRPPPPPPSKPAVPAGQAEAQVTVPLLYNGETPQAAPSPAPPPSAPAASPDAAPSAATQAAPKKKPRGFFHFLHRIFGGK